MSQWENMLAGELYYADDEELVALRQKAKKLCMAINEWHDDEGDGKQPLFEELFASVGENCHIKPHFYCDYGCNITIGKNFFANYDCIILDVCPVKIGDGCLFGPRVSLFAATHPVDPGVRASGAELGKPITIGDNVWLGGGAIINPGVTVGDHAVVASGAVVTKDVPAYTVVGGNPARVLKTIPHHEKKI